jgi:biofilm PGA synthesis N-glycosyltransferase PgaC
MFGNVQVYWRYQDILFTSRYGWLDSLVLPLGIISTIMPLLFLPLLVGITVANLVEGQYLVLLFFAGISLGFQLLRAWVGLALGGEKKRYVFLVPIARLIYGPLRIYLIYASFMRALRGVPVGWNKLSRVGMLLKSTTSAGPPAVART